CYICKKNCEDEIDSSYYCICDVTICKNCIESLKNSNTTWICPNCKEELELEKSRLFRQV
ncbi:MAG: hypothetical protein ACTSRH_13830, partial [Promethearchaeota archaeon]